MPDDVQTAPPPARHLVRWTLVVLGILGLPVLIYIATRAVFQHIVRPPDDTPSTRKLHEISVALHRFAQEHNGEYPGSLADLGRGQNPPVDLSTIPGGRDDYLFPGKGLADQTAANGTVLVYEPITANRGRGSHVLYADGTETFIAAKDLDDELQRGRPPTQAPPE
jgi:hypothetical protein